MKKYFDLNIETVLEHWSISFAVREFISNALDEQVLTNTRDIEILKKDDVWYIKDYGRGIESKHFSQNENEEKLKAKNLIGKFGVGLKDALAVLNRNNIQVKIVSKYVNAHIKMHKKNNFEIDTLHAVFEEVENENFIGTEIQILNISDEIIEEAKSFFLYFNSNKPLETTSNGEVYMPSTIPSIYVNGLQIAQEENFLFSYNITNINAKLKKALNRERSNVGRSAYSDVVKNILLKCKSQTVLDYLIRDVKNYTIGTQKDESKWTDVASYAALTLNKTGKYIFVSALSPFDTNQNEIINTIGREIITLPENIYSKLSQKIFTYDNAVEEYNSSFEFDIIPYNKLSKQEKSIYNQVNNIRSFFKKHSKLKVLPKVNIVKSLGLSIRTKGLWDEEEIWVVKSALKDERGFIETVSHEYAHSLNNYSDNTREFESDLGEILSYYALHALKKY